MIDYKDRLFEIGEEGYIPWETIAKACIKAMDVDTCKWIIDTYEWNPEDDDLDEAFEGDSEFDDMDENNDFLEDSLDWINDQLKDLGLEFSFDGYGEGGYDDDNGWDYEDVFYNVIIDGNEERICFECCDNEEGSVYVYREGSDIYQTWVEFMNTINGNDSDFNEL